MTRDGEGQADSIAELVKEHGFAVEAIETGDIPAYAEGDQEQNENPRVDAFIEENFESLIQEDNPYLTALIAYRELEYSRYVERNSAIPEMKSLDNEIYGENERFYFALDEMRTFRKHFSWAIPSEEAIAWLADHSPLVEIGARSGYWAWMVEEQGGDIFAYDREVPDETWTNVEEGTPEKIVEHPDAILFLCWPHFQEPMASECLDYYEGDMLVHVGEGPGGATGDEAFWDELEADWTHVERIGVPEFMGIHDTFQVWERQ